MAADQIQLAADLESRRGPGPTVTLDSSLPDELVFGLLEDSYELVVDGLPRRERDRVRLSANR